MYLSDKPNYPLLQTLLDSLHQDLRLLMDPPDGSKEHPATTCLELWLCHPDYTSGQKPYLYLYYTVEVRSLHTLRLESLKIVFQPLHKCLVNKL